MDIKRRRILVAGGAVIAAPVLLRGLAGQVKADTAGSGQFEVTHSEAEWRSLLSADEYAVLREHETERAGTSPLLDEKRAGTFQCAGCGQALFSSKTKYDSGTGWPSFWAPIDESAVGTREDRSLIFMVRTEVHCSRCGGHHGHIFEDGPEPTGLRYCVNGVALDFMPA